MNANGKCIMLQGTSSHVGKSLLATGLCRHFYRRGFRVAPFKSQNMALNSYVTSDGLEIGRAQGVQAEAAGLAATVEMNPILLKPKEDMVAQVIVMGKPYGDLSAREYRNNYLPTALEVVAKALDKIRGENQVVVIEGAGSPAEINLKERDIANMRIAFMAEAPVILVADIDRGGVFASLLGTLELLTPAERKMVGGFIINKFRGDVSLLQPGLQYLEERTGLPVLGVVPFVKDLGIEEEDSVSLQDKKAGSGSGEELNIAVVKLPHISNYTDFNPLEAEEDVILRYVEPHQKLGSLDAVIIPGTKNTTNDLLFLNTSGCARQIREAYQEGVCVVGICGGFQMMGVNLLDPDSTESSELAEIKGLDLLPMTTTFRSQKLTRQVKARISSHRAWGELGGLELEGYEIRHGCSTVLRDMPCLRVIPEYREEEEVIGLASEDMRLLGSYLHNLFHNDLFRRRWLNTLRAKKGLPPLEEGAILDTKQRREESYDRLAAILEESLDMEKLYRLMGLNCNL